MHYRNGRPAKDGDKVVQFGGFDGKIVAFGVLHSTTPDNDYCNGQIAAIQHPNITACIIDCLHLDDVEKMFIEKNLDKRPKHI